MFDVYYFYSFVLAMSDVARLLWPYLQAIDRATRETLKILLDMEIDIDLSRKTCVSNYIERIEHEARDILHETKIANISIDRDFFIRKTISRYRIARIPEMHLFEFLIFFCEKKNSISELSFQN